MLCGSVDASRGEPTVSAALRIANKNNHAPVTARIAASTFKPALARSSLMALPALAVLGIAAPASALELGTLDIQSTLGQPLRASIAFALNPHEEISSYCIYVTPGRSTNGLPSSGPASVVVENGSIRLTGRTAVNDPLLAVQVTVDCPYAAHLRREYVAFVDPAAAVAAVAEPASVAAPREPVRSVRQVRDAAPVARVQPAPIAASTTYRVQPGDTLSGIAQRMTGRSVTIWEAVEALFAANPDAFIAGNRDFLKAGALLRVPDAIYAADAGEIASPVPVQEPPAVAGNPAATSKPYSGYRNDAESFASGRAVVEAPAPVAAADVATAGASVSVATAVAAETAAANEPAPAAEAAPAALLPESRPGTSFEAPSLRTPARSSGAWSWLVWLGGSGIALILALLLGRPLRKRFGAEAEPPLDDDATGIRPGLPAAMIATPEAAPATSGMEVDFHFDEAQADARLIQLDGDVEDGSGFHDAGDIDVAEDFGFSASGGIELGLDVEFPEEPASAGEGDTNVIPPMRREGDVIVDSEVSPHSEETGTYDMSMIVDATQQPIGDSDDTTRDLHAVELVDGEAAPEEDPFTLSREMDYKILEQDYQDELTATQALNAQLEDAARDLAESLGAVDPALPDAPTEKLPFPGSEETAPHPMTIALAEADTVEMPAPGDDEDTGVNEELQDLPAAENDATAAMEIESATVDTKKMKVS